MMDQEQQAGQPGILQQNMQQQQSAPTPPQQGTPQPAAVQPNEEMAEQVETGLVGNSGDVKISKAQQMQLEAYYDNATMAVFSEKSQPAILHLLQQGQNKVDSVSSAAFTVHNQLEKSINDSGEKLTEVALALGAAHLISEIVVLADAAGLFSLNNEEQMQAYQGALKKYFEAGLANGTVDPIKLQESVEPLLSRKQEGMAMDAATKAGLSKTQPPGNMRTRPPKGSKKQQQASNQPAWMQMHPGNKQQQAGQPQQKAGILQQQAGGQSR